MIRNRNFIKKIMLNLTENEISNAKKMLKYDDISCFKTIRCCIYLIINVKMMAFKHLLSDKFHAQLS